MAGIMVACIVVAGIGAYFLMKPGPEGGEQLLGGDWVKESGIRISDGVSSCTITLLDNTYRMYYTGMGLPNVLLRAKRGARVHYTHPQRQITLEKIHICE